MKKSYKNSYHKGLLRLIFPSKYKFSSHSTVYDSKILWDYEKPCKPQSVPECQMLATDTVNEMRLLL